MIGFIFLGILLATLWTAVVVLHLPWVLALVPTLAAILIGVGIYAFRRFQARKGALEIERTLKAQGEEHAKQVRPDLQPEIQAMQSEFNKAVASLKSSKLARGGSDALSVLPWYMIIGPPGAGKSTALRNSGLQFPYLSARGGGVRGIGGTRNCEWWLTNEAVILDTAGRYTTEEEDRDEWFAFLDTLVKTRPRRPINGILVGISLGDFVELDEERSGSLGQQIRERVDEVMSRLKLIVPVYLVLTKCDLIAGFVEMFGSLPKGEREQIWGFTVSASSKPGTPSETFVEYFDELMTVLEQRALQRLSQVRRLEERERIFQFTAQLEGLKPNLTEFVRTLFAENVYQDTPQMRGAYFTSGTQEGQPIDRVLNAMASAFNIRSLLPVGGHGSLEKKSYFLRDLFSRVIFPDRALVVRSTSESRRRQLFHSAYAVGALAFAVLVLLFPTISFFKNRELIQSTRALVAAVKSSDQSNLLQRLGPLRERLDSLVEYEDGSPPLLMRFGMYQGSELLQRTRGFYSGTVRKQVIEPAFAADAKQLETFIDQRANQRAEPVAGEYIRALQKLKLHLLLSAPKAGTEPPLREAEQAWAAKEIAALWDAKGNESGILGHAALYLKLLATDATLALPRREALVKKSREVLGRLTPAALALERITDDVSREDYDLTLARIVGGTVPELKSRGKVRGAFTRSGFNEKVRSMLESGAQDSDAWVLTPGPQALNPAVATAQLKSLYFSQYIIEWGKFLDSITEDVPSNSTEALALLESLTAGEPPPLIRLFRAVANNTRISDKGGGTVSASAAFGERIRGAFGSAAPSRADSEAPATEKVYTAKEVQQKFDGFVRFGAAPEAAMAGSAPPPSTPLDVYQEQLIFVRDAMRADIESQDHAPLMAGLQRARIKVKGLIDSQEVGWHPRLEALLLPPMEAASRGSARRDASDKSQKWCSAVYAPFKRTLANRYPFNRNGQDAALADVIDFFRPQQGTLWAFFASTLQTDVVRSGDSFQAARRPGSVAGSIYGHSVLNFLKRAQEISNALFPPNSEAQVSFSVRIKPVPKVKKIVLGVDGQEYDYGNGPEEWRPMKWPASGKSPGAFLHVSTNKGSVEKIDREGEWGLFKLFDDAQVRSASGRDFTLVWKIPTLDTEISVDVRTSRNDSPFFGNSTSMQKSLFQPFRGGLLPPAGLDGRGCSN